jgi:hypothetical protein
MTYRASVLVQVGRTVAVSGIRSPDTRTLPTAENLRARWLTMDVSGRRNQLDLLVRRIEVSPLRNGGSTRTVFTSTGIGRFATGDTSEQRQLQH